jgi:WhiB family redox-sensing transcriptional regulator
MSRISGNAPAQPAVSRSASPIAKSRRVSAVPPQRDATTEPGQPPSWLTEFAAPHLPAGSFHPSGLQTARRVGEPLPPRALQHRRIGKFLHQGCFGPGAVSVTELPPRRNIVTGAFISLSLARAIFPEVDSAHRERAPWQESAACRHTDTELFFPIGSTGKALIEIHQAKALCAGCPVQQSCLTYALVTGQEFGIWGGYDEKERRLMRTRWRQAQASGPADS